MKKERELRVVGDFTKPKPFLVVEYFRGKNHYVGHKMLGRYESEIKAKEIIKQLKK